MYLVGFIIRNIVLLTVSYLLNMRNHNGISSFKTVIIFLNHELELVISHVHHHRLEVSH